MVKTFNLEELRPKGPPLASGFSEAKEAKPSRKSIKPDTGVAKAIASNPRPLHYDPTFDLE